MRSLAQLVQSPRTLRVIGFDDAPFERTAGGPVHVSGIVCTGTRFEGMLWGQVTCDGDDATEALVAMLGASKFHPQVHLVLVDGLAFGGFNLVDLPALADALERPCVAVMRRLPDLPAVHRALSRLPDVERRMGLLAAAGPIHQLGGFVFQVAGAAPAETAVALGRLTDTGKVPECLRLAHLIGAAVKTGSSGRRA
jgi:uncharacterized protein